MTGCRGGCGLGCVERTKKAVTARDGPARCIPGVLSPAAVEGIAEPADGGDQGGGHQVGGYSSDAGKVPRLVLNSGTAGGQGEKERCPRDRGKQRGCLDGQAAFPRLLAAPPPPPQCEPLPAGRCAP